MKNTQGKLKKVMAVSKTLAQFLRL